MGHYFLDTQYYRCYRSLLRTNSVWPGRIHQTRSRRIRPRQFPRAAPEILRCCWNFTALIRFYSAGEILQCCWKSWIWCWNITILLRFYNIAEIRAVLLKFNSVAEILQCFCNLAIMLQYTIILKFNGVS